MDKYYKIRAPKFYFYFTFVIEIIIIVIGVAAATAIFVLGGLSYSMILGFMALIFPIISLVVVIQDLKNKDKYFAYYYFDSNAIYFQNGSELYEMKYENIVEAGIITWFKRRNPLLFLRVMYFSERGLYEDEVAEIYGDIFSVKKQHKYVFSLIYRKAVMDEVKKFRPDLEFTSHNL